MQADETLKLKDYFPFITLLLGWVLGQFGNYINEKLKSRNNKKEIKIGILEELKNTKYQIASYCFDTTLKYKSDVEITMEWSKWIRPYYEYMLYSNDYIKYQNYNNQIDITTYSDEQFYNFIKELKRKTNTYFSYYYPEITFPFIEMKYSNLSQLGVGILLQFSILRKQIVVINYYLNILLYYHKVRFECSEDMYFAIEHNSQNIQSKLPIWFERIVRIIENIESKL